MESEKEREVILQKEIQFSCDLIWKAMTEPEHSAKWWGPNGFKNEDMTMDFRVGGAWTFVMVGPDGTRFPNHSIFKEIIPPHKIVSDHGDGIKFWFESTITIDDTLGGSLVTLRHLFPTREFRDEVVDKHGAIEGGKQHLAKLEAYLINNLS